MNLSLFGLETNLTTDAGLGAENKTFYDKTLIKLAKPNLIHGQFGQERKIPKNGGKQIEFRKFMPLGKATEPLTEGVTPDGQKLSVATQSATVHQYGGYVTISDELDMTSIDPIVTETVELISDQAAKTLDTIERDVLISGTNVQYGDGSVEERSAVTKDMKMSVDVLKRAVRALKTQNASKSTATMWQLCTPHAPTI